MEQALRGDTQADSVCRQRGPVIRLCTDPVLKNDEDAKLLENGDIGDRLDVQDFS